MAYEYSTTVQVATVDVLPQASGDEIHQQWTNLLSQTLQTVTKILPNLRGGGWEIISHDHLVVGNHWVISFLLRRPDNR